MTSAPVKPPAGFEEPIPGYRLADLLGRGGFGEVWRATAPGGIPKAVKLIFGSDSACCTNELKALNRVKDARHPFLLSIERIEQRDGSLIIVTELGDRNLQELYREYREKDLPGIPQGELLILLHDAAEALDFIYEEYALQHLDIKPANLLLFGKRLKVADYGLVKNIYERSQSLVSGLTPAYAAPEIFEGQPTRASDQYSLAIVYYELLTGKLPFDGTNAARLAAQHLRETPNLRHLPVEQQSVIARALSKDPEQRFPGCKALIEALSEAVRRAETGRSGVRADVSFTRSAAQASSGPGRTPDLPKGPSANPAAASFNTIKPSLTVATCLGDPATERVMPPTLVVGVGGAAAHLLQRLKVSLRDRLGGVSAVPGLKLVLIDTDPQTLNEVNRDHSSWSDLETVATPLRNSAEYRQQGQQQRRWLSRRWLYNIPRSLRTEGLRPLGRLALVSNSARVIGALRAAIKQVATAAEAAGTADGPPRVLLVGSISGGTGSGMLLDLAYTLRAELQTAGYADAAVEGFLLHATPADAGRDKSNLNALVTLQELLFYGAPGNFYPGEPLLETPPFHGNNCTFRHADVLHLGNELDTAAWLRQIDHVAEYLYARLTTSLDRQRRDLGAAANSSATVNLLQVRQIGANSPRFVEHLSRMLCLAVTGAWLGKSPSGTTTTRKSGVAATMVLNAGSNDRRDRLQQLTVDAEAQVRTCGADTGSLLTRAHEALTQELGTDARTYLQRRFHEALNAAEVASQPDHVVAQAALKTLDETIGVDFGEDPERNKGNNLFGPLHARLVSQAMQVAAKLTSWIAELIDHRDWGSDAALHAAEVCRHTLRDLNRVVTQELQAARNRQTAARISLTAAPPEGEAAKTGRNWLGGRSRNRVALEEDLVDLGMLCFEELTTVCVQWQLRAMESQVSLMIDQLLNLCEELGQLQHRWHDNDSEDPSAANFDLEPLEQLMHDNNHRLVAELRHRIDRDVLDGPKKLQRFLHQRGALLESLFEPLQRQARSVVLHCSGRLITLLLQQVPGSQNDVDIDLDACLRAILKETWTAAVSRDDRAFIIAPADAMNSHAEWRMPDGDRAVIPVYAQTTSLTVCREAADVPLIDLINSIGRGQKALWDLAENLHSRIDVAWSPLSEASGSDVSTGSPDEESAPAEPIDSTLCLETVP
ncbi:MAG: tubulin-like doman-containing protein [Planctomycetaceae bacterium]|nr:tubulin-like doman-containing protein [Planctomycetaceae bacterium]